LASLRAKSRLHSGKSESVNKILSLSGFLILMVVGWIALCYVRSSLGSRSNSTTEPTEAAAAQLPLQPQEQPLVKLVYSGPADKIYYHNATHVPGNGGRSALSEEAARRLGLRPCPICIRRQGIRQSPAELERRGASESPK
jgi:hypothetical protein